MDLKNKEATKIKELETRLKEIDKDLSNRDSIGKRLARTKIQEQLDCAKSDLYFHN